MTSIEPAKPYTLTTEAWETIKPILIRLYRLTPPARLPVSFTDPVYTNRARDWLYKYFKEMNLKSLYRIRRESELSFSIQCLEDIAPIFSSEDIYSPTEAFVREYLLDIDSEAEAIKIAQAKLASGELTDTSFLAVIEEWRRVMGLVQEDKPSALDSLPSPDDLFALLDKPSNEDESV